MTASADDRLTRTKAAHKAMVAAQRAFDRATEITIAPLTRQLHTATQAYSDTLAEMIGEPPVVLPTPPLGPRADCR